MPRLRGGAGAPRAAQPRVELQVALDRLPLARAVAIARDVAPHADWIEVGTSLIKTYGKEAIVQVVGAAGDTPVLADAKIADDAAYEVALCLDAGARAVTVLAVAEDATIDAVIARADTVIDLMATSARRRDELVARHPGAVFSVHVGKDAQRAGRSVFDELGPWAAGVQLAVAGGLQPADVKRLTPGARAIVGAAISGATDPVQALKEFT
jgi:3-hexulose-6-phosphate synthase